MYPGQRTAAGNPMLHDYATPQFGGAGVAAFPDGRTRFVDRTMPRPAANPITYREWAAANRSGLEGLPAAPGTRPIAQAPISRQAPAGTAMPPSQDVDNPFLRATGMGLNPSLPAPDYNRRLSAMMAKFNRMSGGGMMPAMGMGGRMNMQTERLAGGMQLAEKKFGHDQDLLKQKNALEIAMLKAEREGSVPEATKLQFDMLAKLASSEGLSHDQRVGLLQRANALVGGNADSFSDLKNGIATPLPTLGDDPRENQKKMAEWREMNPNASPSAVSQGIAAQGKTLSAIRPPQRWSDALSQMSFGDSERQRQLQQVGSLYARETDPDKKRRLRDEARRLASQPAYVPSLLDTIVSNVGPYFGF